MINDICKIETRAELNSLENNFTGLLSRAFYDDPYYVYIMPDSNKRFAQLQWWMKILLRYTLIYGGIYYTQDHKSVAMWIGPDKPILNDFRLLSMGLILYPVKVGFKNFIRALDISGQWEREHKKMNYKHYYLMVMAVEPEFQGQGIGSHLMQDGLKWADDKKLECYLETCTAIDVKFYKKHGFEVVFNKRFAEDSQYWLMTRNAM